jgi:hypothetical protein
LEQKGRKKGKKHISRKKNGKEKYQVKNFSHPCKEGKEY